MCNVRHISHVTASVGPRRGKTCPHEVANNKGTDQAANPHSLISTFLFAFCKLSSLDLLTLQAKLQLSS